jgi:hypothetical protein
MCDAAWLTVHRAGMVVVGGEMRWAPVAAMCAAWGFVELVRTR